MKRVRVRMAVFTASRRAVVGVAIGLACGCSAFDASLLRPFAGSESTDAGSQAGSGAGGGAGTAHAPPDTRVPMDAGAATAGAGGGTPARDASVEPGAHDGSVDGDDDAGGGVDADAAADAEPPACTASEVGDACAQLSPLPAPAVLDGELDCGPKLHALAPVGWNGASPIPADHVTEIAAAWRADGLYLYVRVTGQAPSPHPSDQPIWCGDAVEIYVDADGVAATSGNYDAPGSMQFIVAAPSAPGAAPDAERFVQGSTQGDWSTAALAVATLADGYAIETFIAAADLGLASWTPATQVGLDIGIGVAGQSGDPNLRCGLQLGQYFLRVGTGGNCNGEPWCDTRAFCVPQLMAP